MTTETLEVKVIARASAVLIALCVALLLSSVEFPRAPVPGDGDDISVRIVRKLETSAVALARAVAPAAKAAAPAAAAALANEGFGADVRLWLEGPAGEIIFVSAERFARCQDARAHRREDADCPSASDIRRMVLRRA